MGVLKSRIGASTFWILPRVWDSIVDLKSSLHSAMLRRTQCDEPADVLFHDAPSRPRISTRKPLVQVGHHHSFEDHTGRFLYSSSPRLTNICRSYGVPSHKTFLLTPRAGPELVQFWWQNRQNISRGNPSAFASAGSAALMHATNTRRRVEAQNTTSIHVALWKASCSLKRPQA